MMQTRGFAHDFVFLFKRFYFSVSRPFIAEASDQIGSEIFSINTNIALERYLKIVYIAGAF